MNADVHVYAINVSYLTRSVNHFLVVTSYQFAGVNVRQFSFLVFKCIALY